MGAPSSWTGPSAIGAALLACCLGGCSAGSGASGPHGATDCTYPAGPYGTSVGDVVDPSLTWQGYQDDGTQAQPIAMRSYFDCDGAKGVTALLIDESATWCPECQTEAQRIAPEVTSTWKSHGVHVVTLMAEDQAENPATLTTALSWRNEYALTSGAVCADPSWTTKQWGGAPAGGNGFPTNIVIDPRTMKIIALQPSNVDGVVANLAVANGG